MARPATKRKTPKGNALFELTMELPFGTKKKHSFSLQVSYKGTTTTYQVHPEEVYYLARRFRTAERELKNPRKGSYFSSLFHKP